MRDKTPNLTDYEKTYREFKWEIPEYYNFGFDGIDRWAEDRTKLALISVDDTGVHAVRNTFGNHQGICSIEINLFLFGKTLPGNSRLLEQVFGIQEMFSRAGVHRRITQDHHRKDQKIGTKEWGDRKEKREMTREEVYLWQMQRWNCSVN